MSEVIYLVPQGRHILCQEVNGTVLFQGLYRVCALSIHHSLISPAVNGYHLPAVPGQGIIYGYRRFIRLGHTSEVLPDALLPNSCNLPILPVALLIDFAYTGSRQDIMELVQ